MLGSVKFWANVNTHDGGLSALFLRARYPQNTPAERQTGPSVRAPDVLESPSVTISRVILLILDSVGAGPAPDAGAYGDDGASTLTNTARKVGGMRLPNLERLGLGKIVPIDGVAPIKAALGAYGKMQKVSPGRDSATGHWEIAGLETREPFATFPDGFPPEITQAFERETGRGILGNRAASGQVMIDQLGEEHLATGRLIVYTSADSVFQVAAHDSVMPAEELYDNCKAARRILDPYRVCRVIARPFKGRAGKFESTYQRRDFAMPPSRPTVFDHLRARGLPVIGVGKVSDIFSGRGVSETIHTQGNTDGIIKMIEAMTRLESGLVVTNLVDFDSRYGHRRDPRGYARCLEEFDIQLAMLLSRSQDGDLLLLTADHGNDPTRPGSDHTRELVPILAAGPSSTAGVNLGTRRCLADVGATIADVFGVEPPEIGESFLKKIS